MKAEEAVRVLISHAGDDPKREGVQDTPARVVKSYREIFAGYHQNPKNILSRQFSMDDDDPSTVYGGMVLLAGFEFYSTCEHHMLPFTGTASVAYVPGDHGRVVGISKLARLVDCFSRRLQCQERITTQVANSIVEHLDAKGVLVVLEAEHFCMRCRGVKKQNSTMITSEVRGVFESNSRARTEAMSLMQGAKK